MISSILSFCFVLVLGSYLLKFGQIGVKQFCAACIVPLPFCCLWLYLWLRNCRYCNHGVVNTIEQSGNAVKDEHDNDETSEDNIQHFTSYCTDANEIIIGSKATILNVLLGHIPTMMLSYVFICFHMFFSVTCSLGGLSNIL